MPKLSWTPYGCNRLRLNCYWSRNGSSSRPGHSRPDLERDRLIIGIIQDIASEQLRGAEERVQITHRYLQEIEANYAAFSARVQERYDELQRLETLNQTIAAAIAAHDEAIQANLSKAEILEQQNQEKLDALIQQETPTPVATPAVSEVKDEVTVLARLLERGLITREQFDSLRERLQEQ